MQLYNVVKIVGSAGVDFRDESDYAATTRRISDYAAYLPDSDTRAIFTENFSSICSVLSSPLERNNKNKKKKEDETNMPPHMNPKTPPEVSKNRITRGEISRKLTFVQ